ncbi:hypothetical protein CCHR01_00842 [Colletotrichum chrysophilum]|uniref:Uncharacterized protein n=1 Tax=Colletotrichum chrysophilum TaxID=1836956 RepID=A0AAD9AXG7_9PEZI|nr:hypothetical protein CCHR01_00842 [Colletotrichum chrysophilum]
MNEIRSRVRPDLQGVRPRSQASDIEVYEANTSHRHQYDRFALDNKITVCFASDYWATDDRVYALVHEACLEIAKKVFASSHVAYIRDLRGLFMALRWRRAVTMKCSERHGCYFEPNYRIWRNFSYRPDINWPEYACPGLDWPGPFPSARANLFYTLGDSPLEIEGLTECLLKNLQQCRSKVDFASNHATRLMEGLAAMPIEVLGQICKSMGPDLPRVSSRVLSQNIWKNTLKAGRRGLLPWLWDIDPALIDAKDCQSCPGGPDFEWDWELLVRQLSRGVDYGLKSDRLERGRLVHQMVTTGYHSDLSDVPAGLHNRRRIWQLLEEMLVGDALPYPRRAKRDGPQPSQKECFPLCWSKSGDILPSPIWLPSIERCHVSSDNPDEDGGAVYFRKIGGEIIEFEGQRRPQYWQQGTDSEKNHEEEQAHNKEGENKDGGENGHVLPASLEDIYAKLRPLGYPV